MNMNQSIVTCFKKFAVFKGRATRSEYWYFVLFSFLCGILAELVDATLPFYSVDSIGPFGFLVTFILFLPSLSVSVRRLHDINFSGWWLLLCITGIGFFIILIFHLLKGTEGVNKYGRDPLKEDTQTSTDKSVLVEEINKSASKADLSTDSQETLAALNKLFLSNTITEEEYLLKSSKIIKS